MARFSLRSSPVVRGPLLLIGATPKRCYAEITDDALEVHFGRYRETLPLASITGAAARDWPWYYGLGVRLAPDAIGYVASTRGVVQVSLDEPHRFRVIFNLRVARAGVALSLVEPEAFIEALEAAVG